MPAPGIGVGIVAEGYLHKDFFFLVFEIHWLLCEQAQDLPLPKLGCDLPQNLSSPMLQP